MGTGYFSSVSPWMTRGKSSLSPFPDFTSISEAAKTLATGEREKAYAGEDFEKLMISVLQGLNYALLGKDEDALVEVRRVNERMLKMIREEKKPYEQLAIARYLSAVLYEDQGALDDAYIDYAAALKLAPGARALEEPVLRLAVQTGRSDDVEALAKRMPGVDTSKLRTNEGQLVVILETGRSPEKVSNHQGEGPQLVTVPAYVNRTSFTSHATVTAGPRPPQTTETVTSLEAVARVHLNDRIGRMLSKQLAGVAVKAGLAAGVGALTKSEALGALTFLALSATNQTDLRSWLSLPAEFEVARFRLPVGDQPVTVTTPVGATQHTVAIHPKRVSLLVLRRY